MYHIVKVITKNHFSLQVLADLSSVYGEASLAWTVP